MKIYKVTMPEMVSFAHLVISSQFNSNVPDWELENVAQRWMEDNDITQL